MVVAELREKTIGAVRGGETVNPDGTVPIVMSSDEFQRK
jgi:hypothetical protein